MAGRLTWAAFIAVFLLSVPSVEATSLFDLQKGMVLEFERTDSLGQSWSVTMTVVNETDIDGKHYYQVREWNYNNEGDIEDVYWRATENAVYAKTETEELLIFDISVPVGTTWLSSAGKTTELVGTEWVTVPYGGPFQAYVFRASKPGTPYCYDYVVPGLGFVKEVDYWTDNAPKITELRSIQKPSQQQGGDQVTSDLWAKAVLQVATDPVTPVTLIWKQVGEDTTPSGAKVVSGYFYADPADFAYGSQYNPEVFVKVYIDPSGWCNLAFNHVTVDAVTISSAHNYSGAADQAGSVSTVSRLLEHQYSGVGTSSVSSYMGSREE